MSKARKPEILKIIEGTYRQDRAPNAIPLPVLKEIPPMPTWMRGHDVAIEEWNKLVKILCSVGILTEAGSNALAVMCMLLHHMVEYFKAGECPPAVLVGQYRNLVNDFGITPVAQTRVKASGEEKPKNNFSGTGNRPERLRQNSA